MAVGELTLRARPLGTPCGIGKEKPPEPRSSGGFEFLAVLGNGWVLIPERSALPTGLVVGHCCCASGQGIPMVKAHDADGCRAWSRSSHDSVDGFGRFSCNVFCSFCLIDALTSVPAWPDGGRWFACGSGSSRWTTSGMRRRCGVGSVQFVVVRRFSAVSRHRTAGQARRCIPTHLFSRLGL